MASKKGAAAPAKKRWSVSVPFTGYVVVEVEADDEKSAIEAALESDKLDINDCEECEFHDYVARGNVFYGVQNEAEALELDS